MADLSTNQLISLGLPDALLDLNEEWGEDVFTAEHCNQKHNSLTSLCVFMYKHDEWVTYTLLENGSVFRVTSKSIDDGYTWNGDDEYFKAHKTIYTFHENVGSITIHDCDYNDDENVENIACQIIELLRDL